MKLWVLVLDFRSFFFLNTLTYLLIPSYLNKESACNAGDLGSIPGLGRSPGEGNGPTPVFLPGESHGQRSLAAYCSWGHRVGHHWSDLAHTHVDSFSQVSKTSYFDLIKIEWGTSLVVQWLRLHVPLAGGPGLVPGWEARSHMPQLRPSAAK